MRFRAKTESRDESKIPVVNFFLRENCLKNKVELLCDDIDGSHWVLAYVDGATGKLVLNEGLFALSNVLSINEPDGSIAVTKESWEKDEDEYEDEGEYKYEAEDEDEECK